MADDPIQEYFKYKLQFVLSRPESLRTIVAVGEEAYFSQTEDRSRMPSIMEILEKKNVLKCLESKAEDPLRNQ